MKEIIEVKIEKELPRYATSGSSGADVEAIKILKVFKGDKEITGEKLNKIKQSFEERGYIKMRAFERFLFGTGVTVANMPEHLEIKVRPRSGKSLKKGLIVIEGTVDSDYRGEIGAIVLNSTPFLSKIEKNTKVAQLVVQEVPKVEYKIVEEITNTERADGGFGHTDNKKN